jgi:hypothetical protein
MIGAVVIGSALLLIDGRVFKQLRGVLSTPKTSR